MDIFGKYCGSVSEIIDCLGGSCNDSDFLRFDFYEKSDDFVNVTPMVSLSISEKPLLYFYMKYSSFYKFMEDILAMAPDNLNQDDSAFIKVNPAITVSCFMKLLGGSHD